MEYSQLQIRPSGNEILAALKLIMAADPSLQVERQRVRGVDYLMFKEQPVSLREWFQIADEFPREDFLVFGEDRMTFGEAAEKSDSFAAVLQKEFNAKKGDRVAIVMRNYPEWVVAFMAAAKIGAIAVPLNGWWTAEEFAYGLSDAGATLVVCDAQRLDRISHCLADLGLRAIVVRNGIADDKVVFHYDRLQAKYAGQQPDFVAIDSEDDAYILYTSGSTGFPKGAVSSHRAVISTLKSWGVSYAASQFALQQKAAAAGVELPEEPPFPPAVLLPVPLFHVTGSNAGLLISFLSGRKVVLMYKWDVQDALSLIERERVTNIVSVPTQSMELMQAPNLAEFDLSSLNDIGGGGAARPQQHVGKLLKTFTQASTGIGYGLTETNAFGSNISGPDYAERPASAGRPTPPTSEIKVTDEDGKEMATGQVGEICLRSPSNMRAYWNRPEETAAAFRDGWFRSGDLGYLDAQGYLFIVDRLKDIIVRAGENISCLEVEACLYHHPDIAEVSVFGVPDERMGEKVGAVVLLKTGSMLEDGEVIDFVHDHLASFKCPEVIWFTSDPLPRTASEKIDKTVLRKTYLTD